MVKQVTSVSLDRIYADELAMIELRREWVRARYSATGKARDRTPPAVALEPGDAEAGDRRVGTESGSQPQVSDIDREVRIAPAQKCPDLVGLALSGGGIRSAAFGLGVLQALNRAGVYRRIDYLSTVSGGGYIGAALSATSYVRRGEFALDNVEGHEKGAALPRNIQDSPAVVHIRNYSNFLVPHGLPDWLKSAALIARGIVTNLALVAPYVLFGAVLTLLYNPSVASLHRPGPGFLEGAVPDGLAAWVAATLGGFLWPALLAALLGCALLMWSRRRSTPKGELESEFKGNAALHGGLALVALLGCLLLSVQNELLRYLLTPAPADAAASVAPGFMRLLESAFLASPLVVFLVSTFGDRLAKAASEEASRWAGALAKQGSRLALLAGAAALPLLIWLVYLRAVHWALQCAEHAGECLSGPRAGLLAAQAFLAAKAPEWLVAPIGRIADTAHLPTATLLLAALVLWLATQGLTPNAHSLHRLYRDRLAKAFIVHPRRNSKQMPWDLDLVHNLRLSQLVRKAAGPDESRFVHGPFPLMNTALNVQSSRMVNRRGRNADFFVFTPLHAGSPATGYVDIAALEQADPNLNLAAVMAISGAAANSNMGANTIRPMSTTLALLNIRLGYWLPNPKRLIEGTYFKTRSLFLWQEMISRLDENTGTVLLTDGGHIENLGVYELLRRNCKVIVVADAEADAGMNFSSLITLQRYARIDLGIRIDLPWLPIAESTRNIMAANAGKAPMPEERKGPHAALGTIDYGNGDKGYLLYLKSSLTGDENDYVRDYGRRNPSFPHETTADQFFSEEQFEAYRALGFHVAFDALTGRADIATPDGTLKRITDSPGKGRLGTTSAAEMLKAILNL